MNQYTFTIGELSLLEKFGCDKISSIIHMPMYISEQCQWHLKLFFFSKWQRGSMNFISFIKWVFFRTVLYWMTYRIDDTHFQNKSYQKERKIYFKLFLRYKRFLTFSLSLNIPNLKIKQFLLVIFKVSTCVLWRPSFIINLNQIEENGVGENYQCWYE